MLKRLIALTGLLLAALVWLAGPAAAAADSGQTNLGYAFDTKGVLALLIGTVLPLLVGVLNRVTPNDWNPGVKALVLLALAGLTAVLTQWQDAIGHHSAFVWQAAVMSALVTFLAAIAAHYQVWKPAGVAAAINGTATADTYIDDDGNQLVPFGVDGPPPAPPGEHAAQPLDPA